MEVPPDADGRLVLTDDQVREIASKFGTPLYVLSEPLLRQNARLFRMAANGAWSNSRVSYASKANSTLAVLKIFVNEGYGIDTASLGEIKAALLAGCDPSRIHLHGNCKTKAELEEAVRIGIGQIVVDGFEEIDLLSSLEGPIPKLLIRLAPGVDPITHEKVQTGQADTKFGLNIADGTAMKAVDIMIERSLPLVGFHAHVGSQLIDTAAQISSADLIAAFAKSVEAKYDFKTEVLNIGGGLGVRFTDKDHPVTFADYCTEISQAVRLAMGREDLVISHEPGRALAAEPGVTLYTVGSIKRVPIKGGHRTYVSVDGGLSDNPRPGLYSAEYTVLHTPQAPRRKTTDTLVRVAGSHCETDMLFDQTPLPEDTQAGDLLQVLTTGAYNSSMASSYNRYLRPQTVLLRSDGSADLVQRLETYEEMFAREVIPEDL